MASFTPHDEQTPQSRFNNSQGCVLNDEILFRTVFDPRDFEKGKPGPCSIPLNHLKENGLSVDRQKYTNTSTLKERALIMQKLKPEGKNNIYFLKLKTAEIRGILFEKQQALVVIDDALEENIAHANIYSNSNLSLKDSQLRGIRINLLENADYISFDNL